MTFRGMMTECVMDMVGTWHVVKSWLVICDIVDSTLPCLPVLMAMLLVQRLTSTLDMPAPGVVWNRCILALQLLQTFAGQCKIP